MTRQRARVYVDGFNVYYRSVRNTPYKWLNLGKLCQFLIPEYDIALIRYFTAIVDSRPGDPQQQQRQQAYLRALGTLPNLTVHLGSFMTNRVRLPLANPAPGGPRTVEVLRTEEKGSDVNLASYLLADGFKGDYDVGVVMSNDSDLIEPITLVRRDLGLPVGVVVTDPRTCGASCLPTSPAESGPASSLLASFRLRSTTPRARSTNPPDDSHEKSRSRPEAASALDHRSSRAGTEEILSPSRREVNAASPLTRPASGTHELESGSATKKLRVGQDPPPHVTGVNHTLAYRRR